MFIHSLIVICLTALISRPAWAAEAEKFGPYIYKYDGGLMGRTDESGFILSRQKGDHVEELWKLPASAIHLQDNKDCEGHCPPINMTFLALDEARGSIYFSVPLDRASNVPFLIYRASLKGGGPERLVETSSSGLANGVVSPNGRYLAYTEGWHGSGCYAGANAEIIDLTEHRILNGPTFAALQEAEKQRDLVAARHLRWLSNSQLEIKNERYPNCREGASSIYTETFDVGRAPVAADSAHRWVGQK